MSRNLTVGPDAFAKGIEQLVGDIPTSCNEACGKAVGQSARRTAKKLRSGDFGKAGKHEWSDEYMQGFSSSVKAGGPTPEGEVGNKAKPGLVHLLEKGHATLTGRRTTAYPHMAPAFEEMQDDFVERVEKYVGEALR